MNFVHQTQNREIFTSNFVPRIFLVKPDGPKMPQNVAKVFCQKSESFPLKVRNWWKNFINYFCSKRSCGHIECNFDNPAEKLFCQKSEFFCSKSENDEKHNFSKNIHLLKMFLWTRGMRFWHSCQNFFTKNQKLFRSFSKNDKKDILNLKKMYISPQNVPVNT